MTAGGPNEWGDDSPKNRFTDPATGEAYFLIIDKKTGKTKIYNEEWGADKYIGEYDPDTGKIKYNNNWYGGARKEERAFFNDNKNLIKNQAKTVVTKEKVKEEGLSESEAAMEANKLMGNNGIADLNEVPTAVAVDGTQELNEKTKQRSFVYPATLRTENNIQDTIKITQIQYVPSGLDDSLAGAADRGSINYSGENAKKLGGTVVLPIPTAINAANATDWSSNSMTAVEAAQANFLLQTGEAGVDTAISGLEDKFDKANMGDVKTALINAIASGAGKGNDLLSRTKGQVLNPNMEVLFKGPSLREFSFTFQFAPRNSAEGKTVLQIIRFFKQGMAPIRTKGKLFLKTPNIFELQYTYNGGQHKGLNRFKECSLVNTTVDYTPNGTYSTYEDGVMTGYELTLEFKELTPIYSDDYGASEKIPAEIGF